jgi:radical SAM superfamily enzyme YgiQ (UPF0313 family)
VNILLIVYDNKSYINWFPSNIAYIASALNKEHEVTIFQQDINHLPEENLTEFIENNDFQVVGLGMVGGYYQYKKLIKISCAINKAKNRDRFKYVLGGHISNPEPEYFLKLTKADFVVIGEGDITIQELVNNLDKPKDVNGIAYLNSQNELVKTEDRGLINNIDSLNFPQWNLFDIEHYSLLHVSGFSGSDKTMAVLTGRGCPYACNFCYKVMKRYRPRNIDSIVEEVRALKKNYDINGIYFADDLLMSSVKRMTEMCEGILKNNLNIKWYCSGRLNFANIKLLKLMKRAGCIYVNYGIESLDDVTLKIMKKNLTVSQIITGVENTIKADICPGLNVIFGNIGETKDILKKGVAFLKKYNTGREMRTIRNVTPYPGSPLYYYAIEKGLLKDVADFYENKHINSDLLSVNFTSLTDKEFHQALKEANIELIDDYYEKNKKNSIAQCKNLYDNLDASFRGFRQL